MDLEPTKGLSMVKIFIWAVLSMLGSFCLTIAVLYFTSPSQTEASPSESIAEKIEPSVEKIISRDTLVKNDTVTIIFNTDIATSTLPLSFNIPGTGTWKGTRTYEFTVGDISPDKTYSVKLITSSTTNEWVRELLPAREVISTFITKETEREVKSPIEISFNQPVDTKSAENAFHISPSSKGTFSWRDNNLIFTPTKLKYQTDYKITIDSGVEAIHGFPSVVSSILSFNTNPEVTKLDVPHFQQQYINTCEAASLRMALAYFGINTNDQDIVLRFGYNPRAKDEVKNEWDDPHKMFVGSINSTSTSAGYGVYGEPVVRAAESYGREAEYLKTITPTGIAEEIKAGHPIIMWGYTSITKVAYTWNLPDGGTAKAIKGEHARLIIGVVGNINNPLGFYVHDPANGNQAEYWPTESLMDQFNSVPDVTNQAVIVS